MAEKKAHEVDGWLRRPDPQIRLVLVYGPDRGLVAERARAFAVSTGLSLDDPFSVIRLEGAEVEREPGRLIEEAAAVPMFSDRRLIWVRGIGAGAAIAGRVAELSAGGDDAVILLEAGELKKGTGLRAAVEKSAGAMALPCYSDDGRGLDALIEETLSREGLSIDTDAKQVLRASLGGDRLATRGELEKLVLYCKGSQAITAADVDAAIGDVSTRTQEDMLDAVVAGEGRAFDRIFASLSAAGGHPGVILGTALRRFQALDMLKAEMAAGKSAQAAVSAARPPIFFARRRAFEAALGRWSEEAIATALLRLDAAILETRLRPALGEAIARQVLLTLALEARRLERVRA